MTPAKRSAQSLGRNTLPCDVMPCMKTSFAASEGLNCAILGLVKDYTDAVSRIMKQPRRSADSGLNRTRRATDNYILYKTSQYPKVAPITRPHAIRIYGSFDCY